MDANVENQSIHELLISIHIRLEPSVKPQQEPSLSGVVVVDVRVVAAEHVLCLVHKRLLVVVLVSREHVTGLLGVGFLRLGLPSRSGRLGLENVLYC